MLQIWDTPPQRYVERNEKHSSGQPAVTKDYSKRHHDAKAQDRSFAIGDKVLVFSPVITGRRPDKLNDRWQGPYEVLGKVSPVSYLVHKKQN